MEKKNILLVEKKEHEGGIVTENIYHDSSNLLKTSYNYNTKRLVATFIRNATYIYIDVPANVYEGFKQAESSGKYLNSVIKKDYKVVKLSEAPLAEFNGIVEKINELKAKNIVE